MALSDAKYDLVAAHLHQLRNPLINIIEVNFGLLDELRGSGVLKQPQYDVIGRQTTATAINSQLLDVVINSSRSVQKKFLVALYKTGQTHVNNYILSGGHRPATYTENWPLLLHSGEIKCIQANWSKLIELIDTKYGLLDELVSVAVISRRQDEYIRVAETGAAKNERLLQILQKRSVGDYSKFIYCLFKTKQQHAAFLLAPYAAWNTCPLSYLQTKRLTVNHASLVSLIDTKNGLLAEMYSSDCITRRQKEAIESAATQSDSNMLLLNIVARSSESDFNKFVNCLRRTGQQHVSQVLLEEGVVVRPVARFVDTKRRVPNACLKTLLYSRVTRNVRNTCGDVRKYESYVVDRFMTLLKICNVKRRQELYADVCELIGQLSSADIQLIATNRQHSIAVFFLCRSLKGLMQFERFYFSGQLQAIVTKMFTFLCDDVTVACNSFTWDISEYTSGVRYFCSFMGLSVFTEVYQLAEQVKGDAAVERCGVSLHAEQLPFELIEMLMIKAARQLYVKMNTMTTRAATYTLATLGAVSVLWWQILTYQPFNKRELKRYFRHVCRPYEYDPQQLPSLHIDGGHNVLCLSESNDKLYVACCGSGVIRVYCSRQPFDRLADIKATGLVKPSDMAVCGETRKLYIADRQQCAILRVNLMSYKQVDQFITTDQEPSTMSVKSRRLLITPEDGDALFIYGDDGIHLNFIPFPDYVHAHHAVESSSNTYIVSHCNRTIADKQNGVSEFDVDGRIIRQFNNHLNGGIPLNESRHLLIDASNNVVVADYRNERIVLLNPDLQLKRVLITKLQGLPFRMCFSERSGLLFVCSKDSSAIRMSKIYCNLSSEVDTSADAQKLKTARDLDFFNKFV